MDSYRSAGQKTVENGAASRFRFAITIHESHSGAGRPLAVTRTRRVSARGESLDCPDESGRPPGQVHPAVAYEDPARGSDVGCGQGDRSIGQSQA
ncbi:hypothetical protein B1756_04685 [Natrarchaeobaculum aegyptiacum]|uniref:Uncharacterized protein n=1 Tax=Natrarchaeobaculum aegyptiacum TaxID=745377 RepID=A0A2Z2HVQ5_9EURY|nr:hypothetical protein B1756_04685 [Natrarchaeobaculum aegyptiacum]